MKHSSGSVTVRPVDFGRVLWTETFYASSLLPFDESDKRFCTMLESGRGIRRTRAEIETAIADCRRKIATLDDPRWCADLESAVAVLERYLGVRP